MGITALKMVDIEGNLLASYGNSTTIGKTKLRRPRSSSAPLSLLVNASSFHPSIESYKRGYGNARSGFNELRRERVTTKFNSYGKQKIEGFEGWGSRIVSNISISAFHIISRDTLCCKLAFPHPDTRIQRTHDGLRSHRQRASHKVCKFEALHYGLYLSLRLVACWITQLFSLSQEETVPQFRLFQRRKEPELQLRVFSHSNTRSPISLNDPLRLDKDITILGLGHKFNSTEAGDGNTSSTNAPLPVSTMSRKGSTTSHGTKRSAFSPENDDLDGDGEDQRNPKRSKSGSDSVELGQRFACPYRKHDPRKYSVQDWRICALTHHKTIARVKAHLYRYHLIHQCQRCKEIFESENELDSHFEALEGCELRPGEPVDGITRRLKEQIQSRKKANPNQTEAEKWQQIYRMLFLDESAPDPYFEPVIDQGDNIPQSADSDADGVSNLEEFLRHEVPQIFRTLLETMQPQPKSYEEDLRREQLIEILEKAQNQAFKKYGYTMRKASSSETVSQVPASHLSAISAIGQQTSSPRDLLVGSHSVQWSSGQKFGSTSSTSSRSTIRSQPVTTSRDASMANASQLILPPASPQSFAVPYSSSATNETRRVVEIGRIDEENTA